MMIDLVYLLIVFGITNALVFLHVGSPIRKLICGVHDETFFSLKQKRGFRIGFLGRLIHCHACSGFWIGTLFSFLFYKRLSVHLQIEEHFYNGFLSSAFCFILWVILVKLGAKKL